MNVTDRFDKNTQKCKEKTEAMSGTLINGHILKI